MKFLLTIALLTVFPLALFADNGNVRVNGRVQLRADVDVPFSADAAIPGPDVQTAPPAPITTQPAAPAYQYAEPAPIYEYAPQYQARVRYRLRVQPARLYYQPVVTYEPTAPVLLGDPCLTGIGSFGYLGGRRERLDIRYRYRSGW